MNQIHSCRAIDIGNEDFLYNMAFDGYHYYGTIRNNHVAQLNHNFELIKLISTARQYENLTYDCKEDLFWATAKKERNILYKLDSDFNEIEKVTIYNVEKFGDIVGIAYNECNDNIVLAYNKVVIIVDKSTKESTVIYSRKSAWITGVSFIFFKIFINIVKDHKRYVHILSHEGNSIQTISVDTDKVIRTMFYQESDDLQKTVIIDLLTVKKYRSGICKWSVSEEELGFSLGSNASVDVLESQADNPGMVNNSSSDNGDFRNENRNSYHEDNGLSNDGYERYKPIHNHHSGERRHDPRESYESCERTDNRNESYDSCEKMHEPCECHDPCEVENKPCERHDPCEAENKPCDCHEPCEEEEPCECYEPCEEEPCDCHEPCEEEEPCECYEPCEEEPCDCHEPCEEEEPCECYEPCEEEPCECYEPCEEEPCECYEPCEEEPCECYEPCEEGPCECYEPCEEEPCECYEPCEEEPCECYYPWQCKKNWDSCAELIESIALVEKSIASILEAESEKIRRIVEETTDIKLILRVNREVNKTIINMTHLEHTLYEKLSILFESGVCNKCHCDNPDDNICDCDVDGGEF